METIDLKSWFLKNRKILLFIIIAYIFSVAVRFIWVYQFNDVESYKYNGEFTLTTNDGYYFAEGARDLLAGSSEENDRSPIFNANSIITAFLTSKLPFSLETIIFYLPIFLSSLIVIPIILLSKSINEVNMGFIAALIASIGWSYYNRTMAGYYDTDMLNIVLPMILIWSLIGALQTRQNIYLLIAAFDTILYRWWYPQSYSLEIALIGILAIYTAYEYFIEKKEINFNLGLIAILLFATMNIDGFYRILIVLITYLLITRTFIKDYVFTVLLTSILTMFLSGGFDPIFSQLKNYVFRGLYADEIEAIKLNYFSVMNTIREAGKIDFEVFANRISGHYVLLGLSVIGYFMLIFKHRVMIITLPMVGLGFLALVGGLRFTVYAVPIMAIGIAYLIVFISSYLKKVYLQNLFMIVLTGVVLYPHINHAKNYKVPTVFNNQEIAVLDSLKNKASREDYVVAWWDYGYPIRFYSNVKTLIDGGLHNGQNNFPLAYSLIEEQHSSAIMSRIIVEFKEDNYKKNIDEDIILSILKKNKITNPNILLESLKQKKVVPPLKTRDIYYYLPYRMMDILPTINKFSNIDLISGKSLGNNLFYKSTNFTEDEYSLNLGNSIIFDKKSFTVKISNQSLKINNFIITEIDTKGIHHKKVQQFNKDSNINIIYMKNYNTILLLDSKYLNSTYIKLFVLQEYDKKYFEPVFMNLYTKVYKLKI